MADKQASATFLAAVHGVHGSGSGTKETSYREQALLGRTLTLDEVKTFTAIARRIAALVLMRDALDANYNAVAQSTP